MKMFNHTELEVWKQLRQLLPRGVLQKNCEIYEQKTDTNRFVSYLAYMVFRIYEACNDNFAQLNISTATWALPIWLDELGITSTGDVNIDKLNAINKYIGTGNTYADVVKYIQQLDSNAVVTVEPRRPLRGGMRANRAWLPQTRTTITIEKFTADFATAEPNLPAHYHYVVKRIDKSYGQFNWGDGTKF